MKRYEEILATLDTNNKNRGLYFDAEAVPYCGRTYRVLSRVSKILDEKTGKLIQLKNESIILEGVFCQARYSGCRMFCPRAIYTYWREIWLERVSEEASLSRQSIDAISHEPSRLKSRVIAADETENFWEQLNPGVIYARICDWQ